MSVPLRVRENVVESLIFAFDAVRSSLPEGRFTDARQRAYAAAGWFLSTGLAASSVALFVLVTAVEAMGMKRPLTDAVVAGALVVMVAPALWFIWFRLPGRLLRLRMKAHLDPFTGTVQRYDATVAEFDEAFKRSPRASVDWVVFGLRRELRSMCRSDFLSP